MNITNKDVNLLVLFHILYQERNLTLASERLALSQPALSHKLNKLRDQFDDPLFVRASRGLTPTPKAESLAPYVAELVGQLQRFYYVADDTDFLQKEDVVHIYSTDFMEQYLLPKLLISVEKNAPNLQIVSHNTRGKLPQKELESGECDIAIAGFYQNLPSHLGQQSLCEFEFKVLASRGNELLQSGLNMEAYLSCPHLVTTLTGDLNGLVDQKLQASGQSRRVVAGISSFIAPAASVVNSQFLLTCLSPVANAALSAYPDLVSYDCPVAIGPAKIQQIWHKRSQQDPIRKWLREQIKQALS